MGIKIKVLSLMTLVVIAGLLELAFANENKDESKEKADETPEKVEKTEAKAGSKRKAKSGDALKDDDDESDDNTESAKSSGSDSYDDESSDDEKDHEDDMQSDHENGKNIGDAEKGKDWGEDERAYVVHPDDYESETQRLEAQFVIWESEKALYERLGLKDGMNVLDIGCGAGHLAKRILEWLPTSKVVCVDIDPLFIDATKVRLQKYVDEGRLQFVVAPAHNISLASDTYDFAFMRMLIQHVPSPEDVVKEAYRLLKVDAQARLVINDVDESFADVMDPEIAELDDLQDRLERYRRTGTHQTDPTVGRRLPRYLKGAHFTDITMDMLIGHSDVHGMEAMVKLLDVSVFNQLLRQDRVSAQRIQAARDALKKFTADKDAILTCYAMVASGIKTHLPVDPKKTKDEL